MMKKEEIKTISILILSFVLTVVFVWSWVWQVMAIDLSKKVKILERDAEISEIRLIDMTLDRNNYREQADVWFGNYIELGITCGANE